LSLADYHLHTPLCKHAVGELGEYVAAARAAVLDEVGCADHIPMPPEYDPEQRMEPSELPRYIALVEDVRRRSTDLSDLPDLPVRLGLEADFYPGTEEAVREILASHPWDYVLGSVHYIGEWGFDNPRVRDEWKRRDVAVVWREYFELVRRAAESGLFDSLAHFDLVKIFGFRPAGGPEEEVDLARPALEAARAAGIAIEVSTGGLRKPCGEIYPAEAILREALAMGIPVTLGSDAHRPADVAAGFGKAGALLRGGGYKSHLLFERRERREAPLPL